MRGVSSCGDFVRPHFLAIRLLTFTNLDVVGEQSVEEVDVGVAQHGEVLVLLNGRLLHLEQTETLYNCQLQLFLVACRYRSLHLFIWFS